MSNALKSLGKTFKRFTSSKFGKALMTAAAVYYTGQALGAWGGGAQAAQTAAVGAPGAVTGGAAAGAGSGVAAAPAVTQAATKAAATQAAAPTVASQVAPVTTAGTLKGAGKAVLGFIERNPATAMIAGQALSSAFTPTAAEEQMKLERDRQNRSTFYGTGYGGQGPGISSGRLSEVVSGFSPNTRTPAPRIAGTRQGSLSQYAGVPY